MAEIGGSSFQEVDSSDWETCDDCDTKIPPWPQCPSCGQYHEPQSRLFLAVARVDTPGRPDSFHLKREWALDEARQRMDDRGETSHLYVYDRETAEWRYWRSVP